MVSRVASERNEDGTDRIGVNHKYFFNLWSEFRPDRGAVGREKGKERNSRKGISLAFPWYRRVVEPDHHVRRVNEMPMEWFVRELPPNFIPGHQGSLSIDVVIPNKIKN